MYIYKYKLAIYLIFYLIRIRYKRIEKQYNKQYITMKLTHYHAYLKSYSTTSAPADDN